MALQGQMGTLFSEAVSNQSAQPENWCVGPCSTPSTYRDNWEIGIKSVFGIMKFK